MPELYHFIFCVALGIAGRIVHIAASALAKRTDLMPVTVLLDILSSGTVGAGFTVYVIMSGAVLAPYMFAAVLIGYLAAYAVTKQKRKPSSKRQSRK